VLCIFLLLFNEFNTIKSYKLQGTLYWYVIIYYIYNMRITTSFIISILFFINTLAYTQECGSHHMGGEQIDMAHILSNATLSRSSNLIDIPLTIHILRINQQAPISYESIKEELQLVNEKFEPTGYRFVSCEPNYIDDDFFQTIVLGVNDQLFHLNYGIPGTVNVYFVEDIEDYCGFSAYPWFDEHRKKIFMANACLSGGTFEHELGHYFGLYHTHENYFGFEFVNGSNCLTAGDLLCDTNADPQLGYSNVNHACNYTGFNIDPLGYQYDPDPRNLMSYARQSCRNFFSNQQLLKMAFYLGDSGLSYESEDDFDMSMEVKGDKNYKFSENINLEIDINITGLDYPFESSLQIYLKSNGVKTVLKTIDVPIQSNGTIKLDEFVTLPSHFVGRNQVLFVELNPFKTICEVDFDNNIERFEIINEPVIGGGESFFPNPVVDITTTFFEIPIYNQSVVVEIFDSLGQLIFKNRNLASGPEFFYSVNATDYPPGMYTVRFVWTNGDTNVLRFEKI